MHAIYVPHGNKSRQFALVINQQEFFDLVLVKDFFRLIQGCIRRPGNQVALGHHRVDRLVEIFQKLQVSTRKNTH